MRLRMNKKRYRRGSLNEFGNEGIPNHSIGLADLVLSS
jgi:hypothetical protein